VSWEGKRVADYWMQYADWKNREHSWFGSSDEFHIEFFEKRLVVARAYRQGEFAKDDEESLGLFLGSPTYGQHAEPVRYHVGPAFAKIFRCSAEFRLEEARAQFVADNSVAR
jgi:hypothetical protein